MRERLVGALIADTPLKASAFQVVQPGEMPVWRFEAKQTLTLELADTPLVLEEETRFEARDYPMNTQIPVGSPQHKESLLEIIREIVRSIRHVAVPVVVQAIFKPVWVGPTRQEKQKRESGERWWEDPHRIRRAHLRLLDRAREKEEGYWAVTVRILASNKAVALESALNRVFTFKRVRVGRALRRFRRWQFGRRVWMSSRPLGRLVQVPTGKVFGRELLGGITTGHGAVGQWRTPPFPRKGYVLGRDDDQVPICLDDGMLRRHVLIVGETGSWKTSLVRRVAQMLGANPANRICILDHAGEYVELVDHLPGVVLLRPGSDEFPLGINFFDWPQTLGMEAGTAAGNSVKWVFGRI